MARGLKPFYPAFKQKYSHTQSSPCCFFEAATSVPSAPWCQVSCPTRPERVNLNLFEEKNPIKPKKSLIIFALRLCSLVHHTINDLLNVFCTTKKTYSTTQYGTLCFSVNFHIRHAHEIIPGYTLQSFLFPHGSTMFDQNRFGQIWDSDIQGERHCLISAHASCSVFTISLFTYRCVPHKRAIHTHGNCREAYWECICLFKERLCEVIE